MTAASKAGGKKGGPPPLVSHRKARRDYVVLETMEAGIELRGTEVKSLRQGLASLDESFARVENGEALLCDLHIQPYDHGNVFNHDPRRVRKLLLHRREIERLFSQSAVKGLALVPLRLYLRRGRVKVELALCRGKQREDKRQALKERTADLETRRAIAAARRR